MVGARMLRINSDIFIGRGAGVYKVVKVPGLGLEEPLYTPIEVHRECQEILKDEDGTCWGNEYENLQCSSPHFSQDTAHVITGHWQASL